MNNPKMVYYLQKISRGSAWALLAAAILMAVSGWGISQTGVIYNLSLGLLDRRAADALHRAALLPAAFFFLLHVLINIRLRIKVRNRTGDRLISAVLGAAGAAISGLVVYLQYIRPGG